MTTNTSDQQLATGGQTVSATPAERYRSDGAIRLDALIGPELAAHLASYVKVQVHNGRLNTSGNQVKGSLELYGDPAFDALLGTLTGPVSEALGLRLIPTYSFTRVYHRGQALTRHSDRPACEHSVTLHLGASGEEPWPVVYRDLHGVDHHVELGVGDAVAYQGCRLTHWRDPCPLDWYVQVFLHYVDADGPNAAERFDRRSFLGRPAPAR